MILVWQKTVILAFQRPRNQIPIEDYVVLYRFSKKARIKNSWIHVKSTKWMVSKSVICEKSRIAINVKFWVKTWCEFHLSAQRKSFDLWWWQIPRFKAYFKCNLKGLINLCRIIDGFTATEQNISLSNFQSNFWAFVSIFVIPNWFSNCDQESWLHFEGFAIFISQKTFAG